jgi:glycosyltransferase involved in cell wall biosynthesis
MGTVDHRLRILHVTQPTDGGTAAVVRSLLEAGRSAGHSVAVAGPDGALTAWAAATGAERVALDLRRAPTPADLAAVVALRDLLGRFDVVHLHSSKAGAVGRLALASRPRAGRPGVVFTPHAWSWYVGGRSAAVYRAWERWGARWADAITVGSAAELADGRDVLGSARRLVHIPNGVDLTAHGPDGPRAERGEAPLLVCVGRLSRQKGQDLVLRALEHIDATTRLRLVGDGPARAGMLRLAAELGVAERVEMVPATDPRPHYRSADVVVVPSRWEGMALVPLEAMACGATVVVSPAAAGGVLGPPGAVVADPGDPRAYGAVLAGLLADPARRRRVSEAAQAHVGAGHTLDGMTGRYLELYGTLRGR